VLSLPSLGEIDKHLFALVPEPQTQIPGRIAGISLFNIIVIVLILLITAGMAKSILFVKQKYAKLPAVSLSRREKLQFFAGVLLITLLLHFAATIYFVGVIIDDSMGETAFSIAQRAITQRYAGLGYTVDFPSGGKEMIGSSPLWFVDFPYQVLYWRVSGFTRFAAPIEVWLDCKVFDRQGHFVRREGVRYYVLGENRLVLSHRPLP